ncbi:MAG: thermonuclease family protein [Phycisphaerae bacterium]
MIPRKPRRWSHRRRKASYLLRRASVVGAMAAAFAVFALADQAGWLGSAPRGTDLQRYHNRSFRVVNVVDGDTIDVAAYDSLLDEKTTRIRLWGVDTPETVKPRTPAQHFGPQASAATRRWVNGRTVTLRLVPGKERDRYDRLLAYVDTQDGNSLNLRLVAKGYAYADPRFDHPAEEKYRAAQKAARLAGRGLWKEVTDAELPYYYRGRLELPRRP